MALALSPALLWAQDNKPVEVTVTLALPPGTKLAPGKAYNAEITLGNKRIAARFKLNQDDAAPAPPPKNEPSKDSTKSGEPQPKPQPSEAPPTPPRSQTLIPFWGWIVLAAVASIAIGAGGFWYYYRRYLPSKELEPYWNALRAVRARNYEAALPGFTGIESKLPPDLRDNARFFIALCHVHLQDEVEAERILSALHREKPSDENTAYLLAYIRVRRGLDAEATPVLEAMRTRGNEAFRDTSRLIGIVKFRQGMAALRAGDIESAASLFAEVAKLGDFAAFIPSDLRNRHISLGTRALFDRDVDTAREHFEALRAAASGMSPDQGQQLLAKASLGLALAAWIQDDPRHSEDLEKQLIQTCLMFHANGPTELPWPEPQPGSAKGDAEALKRALEEADKNFDLPRDQKDLRRCLRDIHFLRAMHVLRAWSHMDGKTAAQAIPEKLGEILSRLACARALDERFADVYLVSGLLMFYLHEPGPDRTTGVDILEEARKLGVRDPDALEIVNNRERLDRENAGAVDLYQQVLDHYLRDETVRQEVRRDLLNHLATHRSLMNRYKPPDLSRARTIPPTVQEIFERSGILHQRIRAIQLSKPNSRLNEQSEALKQQGQALSQQARELEKTESELLAMTGEALFGDE
jgi:hypothetical protein